MSLEPRGFRSRSQEDHWVPLSDLMTGLMMIFLLVAIVFMLQVKKNEMKTNKVCRIGFNVVGLYPNLMIRCNKMEYALIN